MQYSGSSRFALTKPLPDRNPHGRAATPRPSPNLGDEEPISSSIAFVTSGPRCSIIGVLELRVGRVAHQGEKLK